MADATRIRVRIADIRPGNNPRRDFGDIDALAAAIDATGGQPINPPVVAHDANVYRLADGERRVRALRKLHGEDGMADVLCYESMDEAEEAVAMLATDDKKCLTEEERSVGFQRMMQLGVPEVRVAKVMHRKVGDVRKVAGMLALAPEQATFDQMLAASEFEDEEEQRKVLEAPADRWRGVESNLRYERRRRERRAPLTAELERLGIPVVDDLPDGYEGGSGEYCMTVEAIADWVEGHDHGLAVAKCYPYTDGYYLYLPVQKREAPRETEEQRAARELKIRIEHETENLALALMEWAAKPLRPLPNLRKAVGLLRGGDVKRDPQDVDFLDVERRIKTQDVEDGERIAALTCPASVYEVLKALSLMIDYSAWYWWRDTLAYVDAAKLDGYVPSSSDEWLYQEALKARDEHDAEGGDGDGAQ